METRCTISRLLGLVATLSTLISPPSVHSQVVVVPLVGTVGDAVATDVVKGKTFSSKAAGKGATGTLELHPTAQTFTNSINMKFNLLPAGTFIMGSSNDEPGGPYDDEQPEHQVTLSQPFYMQATEVTQKQWENVMHTAPAGSNSGDDYPVEMVNWYEAVTFANALTSLEHPTRSTCYDLSNCTGTLGTDYSCSNDILVAGCNGYRLPTEAEWEYAARGTTTTAWHYIERYDTSIAGEELGTGFNTNLDAIGWYEFNNMSGDLFRTAAGYPSGTKPIARKQANKWGLYDMSGNVWEWCQDWYDSDYYSDPTTNTNPQGPATGPGRVVRGGGWGSHARSARSAFRSSAMPGHRYNYLGFRLLLPAYQ